MGIALLDLVETALRVAKQALGKRAGKPESPARSILSPTVFAKKKATVTPNSLTD